MINSYQKKIFEKAKNYCDKNNIAFKTFNKSLSSARNDLTPNGKILNFGLFENHLQIANYTFIPRVLNFKNRQFLGGQSSDVWVSNKFQGKGLSLYLIYLALKFLKKKNYKFHYGFPNDKMWKIWKNALNVNYIGNAKLLLKTNKLEFIFKKFKINLSPSVIFFFNFIIKNILKIFLFSINKKYKVIQLNEFPDELDSYIKNNLDINGYYFNKNLNELKWRYKKKYSIFICYDNFNCICGYLIGSVETKENLVFAAIVDYQVNKKNSYSILKLLIKKFENYYSLIHADIFGAMFFNHQLQVSQLKKYGYFKLNTTKQRRTFWMFFQSLDPSINFDLSENKWNISFYDSTDTF